MEDRFLPVISMEPILAQGSTIRFALIMVGVVLCSTVADLRAQSLDNNPFAKQFRNAYQNIPSNRELPALGGTPKRDAGPVRVASNSLQQASKVKSKPLAAKREPVSRLKPADSSNEFQPTGRVRPELNFFQPNKSLPSEVADLRVAAKPKFAPSASPMGLGKTPMVRPAMASDVAPDFILDDPNHAPPKLDEKSFWWKKLVAQPLRGSSQSHTVETNGLVYDTLKKSPRIRALSQTPLIREMQIVEAKSEFDTNAFLKSQFQDRVDPVGDNLSVTNDGTNFLDDHIWNADVGVRRKLETGATYSLSQQLGFRNSNLAFFNPQDQGTATLALNVTQPLLRGRGTYYNRSQILIAEKSTDVAWNAFEAELQNEIQQAVEAYWRLYFDRSIFLQKQRNVTRAMAILAKLQGRAGLDSLPSQIARARSAVLSRKTELANARRDIRNSETEIRRIVSDDDWNASQAIELLPVELPQLESPHLELAQVITTALENRNEIKETIQRARIAAIQRDISTNELLPELSLLMGTYVSTLQGDSQIGDAFVDQFFGAGVKPGYSVGVEFEVPVGNRAAKSRLKQREFQLNRIKAEVDETMQNIIAESQIALRRVESARETLVASTEAISAARMDLEQSQGRWESFALVEGDLVEGQTPTTMLDQLLDAQDRLTAAELVFSQAELEMKKAETALQRTMGTLLMSQQVGQTQPASNLPVQREQRGSSIRAGN